MTDADGRPWTPGGVALLERELVLPADTSSPRAARRLVREVLKTANREEWTDAAELALSELVTNALLHAHSAAIQVLVVVFESRVCVLVGDDSPLLPDWRRYDAQASTGRGLALVASLSIECGIRRTGASGKVLWFSVGDDTPGAAWRIEADRTRREPAGTSVVLLRMPPTLWLSARQHHDALLRELALYAAAHAAPVDFFQADQVRHCISDAVVAAVEEAHGQGRTQPVLPDGHPSSLPWAPVDLDLILDISPTAADGFLALQDALDLAERLAVSGELLILPGLPEIIAVRDWACEQVVAQLAGSPPAPWPGTAHERFETETHGRDVPDESLWDAAVVQESDRGVVAADDANRIIAISAPLADVLGWDPDDLVGRRVVTLIPPALREAHVAGFSRHLSTGQALVLGVPLELPVLHADGRELLCDFVIERTDAGPGRTVYLAWIEPKRA